MKYLKRLWLTALFFTLFLVVYLWAAVCYVWSGQLDNVHWNPLK